MIGGLESGHQTAVTGSDHDDATCLVAAVQGAYAFWTTTESIV